MVQRHPDEASVSCFRAIRCHHLICQIRSFETQAITESLHARIRIFRQQDEHHAQLAQPAMRQGEVGEPEFEIHTQLPPTDALLMLSQCCYNACCTFQIRVYSSSPDIVTSRQATHLYFVVESTD